MANVPDLINLLNLGPRHSVSSFGGQHRTILISKDFTNLGDFVFNSFLQNFSRKDPNTPILLVTLSHDWSNYSSSAAKCGFNLRRNQNKGNVEVADGLSKFLQEVKGGNPDFNLSDFIIELVTTFIAKHSSESTSNDSSTRSTKPLIVMIDDLSILLTLGCNPSEIYRLFALVDKLLRDRSKELKSDFLSHLIVQTMTTTSKNNETAGPYDNNLNYLVTNMENSCDIHITLKSLETGYSTRVDGTIKIVDNRVPSKSIPGEKEPQPHNPLFADKQGEVGVKKAYFFKLGDRRVRLTTSAFVF